MVISSIEEKTKEKQFRGGEQSLPASHMMKNGFENHGKHHGLTYILKECKLLIFMVLKNPWFFETTVF